MTSDLTDFSKGHIASQVVAFLPGIIVNAVSADIYDCGSRLDPVFPDHFRPPDRGDEDISPGTDFRQVPGTGVTNRDCGIALDQ